MASSGTASVLVVDDELFFREVLRGMLVKDGFTVVAEASNGDDAVRMFKEFTPSLVLMDIYMPGMNGIEATREIISVNPLAKVLICSGTGYDDDINAAILAGASGIIYKPFYAEEVMATIKSLLKTD